MPLQLHYRTTAQNRRNRDTVMIAELFFAFCSLNSKSMSGNRRMIKMARSAKLSESESASKTSLPCSSRIRKNVRIDTLKSDQKQRRYTYLAPQSLMVCSYRARSSSWRGLSSSRGRWSNCRLQWRITNKEELTGWTKVYARFRAISTRVRGWKIFLWALNPPWEEKQR